VYSTRIQKAIIHRDLKPSNILVSVVDGKPTPRIIDFGVAKAIGQTLTDRTMYTQIGMLIGTLGYIGPSLTMSALSSDFGACYCWHS
jgi:non-specific serine/threonine protein kinase/serine/threonine-protein kinase